MVKTRHLGAGHLLSPRNLLSAAAVLACTAALAGCSTVETIEGNGVQGTESREVAAFTEVLNLSAVDIYVNAGGAEIHAVDVTCDENLLAYIIADVDNGVLTIEILDENGGRVRLEPETDCSLDITVPTLARLSVSGSGGATVSGLLDALEVIENTSSGDVMVEDSIYPDTFTYKGLGSGGLTVSQLAADEVVFELSGSGDLEVTESFIADAFGCVVSGSGDAELETLEATEATIVVSGSGDFLAAGLDVYEILVENSGSGSLTLESGAVESMDLTITGSGGIAAEGAVAASVTAMLSGSGDGSVTVTGLLEATLSGQGDLAVYGNPIDRVVVMSSTGYVTYY